MEYSPPNGSAISVHVSDEGKEHLPLPWVFAFRFKSSFFLFQAHYDLAANVALPWLSDSEMQTSLEKEKM